MKYYIKERDHPQLGTYFVACGKMSKKDAKREENQLYGYNTMHAYDTEEAYNARLVELKASGERCQ